MKKCGRCQEVAYCSRDCQRGDWKVHKVTCQKVPTGVASAGGVRDTEGRGELPSCLFLWIKNVFWIWSSYSKTHVQTDTEVDMIAVQIFC